MKISEDFYSVQGEGISQGVPAYFIRLTGCNLMCGGKDGKLIKEGKASWHCDSEPVWREGQEISNEELLSRMSKNSTLGNILIGNTHLIWTGGEPTMPIHVESIGNFLDYLDDRFPESTPYSEIETNGTLTTPEGFYGDAIDQVNASPKLANSGMPSKIRINPEAIEQINDYNNSQFKFVISDERDISEMEKDFIKPFNIDSKKIILMPAVNSLEDLSKMTAFAYDMTKKYGYRTITRGHILAWNKVVGV